MGYTEITRLSEFQISCFYALDIIKDVIYLVLKNMFSEEWKCWITLAPCGLLFNNLVMSCNVNIANFLRICPTWVNFLGRWDLPTSPQWVTSRGWSQTEGVVAILYLSFTSSQCVDSPWRYRQMGLIYNSPKAMHNYSRGQPRLQTLLKSKKVKS